MIKLAKSATGVVGDKLFTHKNVENFWLPLILISIVVSVITSGNLFDKVVISLVIASFYSASK